MLIIGALGYTKDQLIKECNASGFGQIHRDILQKAPSSSPPSRSLKI